MSQGLTGKRVMVTGGGGFLGQAVVRRIDRGCGKTFVPRSRDYDLRISRVSIARSWISIPTSSSISRP